MQKASRKGQKNEQKQGRTQEGKQLSGVCRACFSPCPPCSAVKAYIGGNAEIEQGIHVQVRKIPAFPQGKGDQEQGRSPGQSPSKNRIDNRGQGNEDKELVQVPEYGIISVVYKGIQKVGQVKGNGRFSYEAVYCRYMGDCHIPCIIQKIPKQIGN